MMNTFRSSSPRLPQRGVSLIAAIFLLLLFAALAALMANFRNVSELTSAEDVLGTRAHFAARAGVERVMFAVMDPNTVPASAPLPAPAADGLPDCPASPLVLPALPQFPGFTVSVTCAQAAFDEGTRRLRISRIISTATVQGPAGVIERQIEATIEKCRDTASVTPPFEC